MRRSLDWLLVAALIVVPSGCVVPSGRSGPVGVEAPPPRHGPLATRVQNPFLLIFLDLPPARGVLVEPGHGEVSVGAAYSSLFSYGRDGATGASLDGELLTAGLDLRYGLFPGIEGQVGLPFMYGTGGFLDQFIIDYHDALGFSQGGRDRADNDQFFMEIERDGRSAYELEEDRPALGDVPVGLAVRLLEEEGPWPALAVRGSVELPTGDAGQGFGSGHLDAGLGLAAEKGVEGLVLYGNLNVVSNTTPPRFRQAGLRAGPSLSALLGAEVPLGRGFSGVGQVQYRSSPIRGISLAVTADDAVTLSLGGRAELGSATILEAGFTEDLAGETAADISVHLGLGWSF